MDTCYVFTPSHHTSCQKLFFGHSLECTQLFCPTHFIIVLFGSKLSKVKDFAISQLIYFNHNFGTTKGNQIRIFGDCKLCYPFFDHIGHLCISFIRCVVMLYFHSLQNFLKQINLFTLNKHAPLVVLFGFQRIAFFLKFLCQL